MLALADDVPGVEVDSCPWESTVEWGCKAGETPVDDTKKCAFFFSRLAGRASSSDPAGCILAVDAGGRLCAVAVWAAAGKC